MKLGIALDDNLVKRIDEYAEANYLSRSGFISQACNSYLLSMEINKYIKELAICMRKIADTNVIDNETRKKLEDLERVARLFSGG